MLPPIWATTFGEELANRLAGSKPSREFLVDLASWLEREIGVDGPPDSLGYQALARAIIAAGRACGYKGTAGTTLGAGMAFAIEPTEENWDAFAAAATVSFPFGPGDGCHHIDDVEFEHGELGGGCVTGAGCLVSMADGGDPDAVAEAVRRELGAWLDGHDSLRAW
jgi:hypothetical protein